MRRKEKRSYGKEPKRNWMNGIAIMRSKLLRQKQQIGIVIFLVISDYLCHTLAREVTQVSSDFLFCQSPAPQRL
jgi:hypothetical protein